MFSLIDSMLPSVRIKRDWEIKMKLDFWDAGGL